MLGEDTPSCIANEGKENKTLQRFCVRRVVEKRHKSMAL